MKPSIERELEAIRQMVRDLETRLKNERSELGHRVLFGIGRRGEVPAPTEAQRGYTLTTEGWAQVSGSGGAGTPDGHTLAVVTGVLNAEPLSGTIDAALKNLSGTIDGHFNASGIAPDNVTTSTVGGQITAIPLSGTINSAFYALWRGGTPLGSRPGDVSGSIDGHFNALSGTIDSAIKAAASGSQVWSQTTNGTEGTVMTAVIPFPYANTQYYAFITNSTGSNSPVYRVINKASGSFQVVSTAPFQNGDRLDFVTLSGALGPMADVSAFGVLSGTIDARFASLSGTLNARFSSIGGGYLGKGVGATTFAAGSFVKRGPFLFATFSGSSVDPLVVEGNPGSSTDWKITNQSGTPATQSGTILTLNNGSTSTVNAAYRNSMNTGINNLRLIVEAYISTGADAFSFGIVNANEGYSACPGGSIRGHTGSLGVEIDVWDNNGGTQVAPFQTGTAGPYIQMNTSIGTYGNQELEATKYYRYYLDYKLNGANTHVTMSLYRDNYDNQGVDFPGYLAEWICALPSWAASAPGPNNVNWRVGVGGWSGGVSAVFKVRSVFVQRTVPEWDLVSILPHTPRIDWRIF